MTIISHLLGIDWQHKETNLHPFLYTILVSYCCIRRREASHNENNTSTIHSSPCRTTHAPNIRSRIESERDGMFSVRVVCRRWWTIDTVCSFGPFSHWRGGKKREPSLQSFVAWAKLFLFFPHYELIECTMLVCCCVECWYGVCLCASWIFSWQEGESSVHHRCVASPAISSPPLQSHKPHAKSLQVIPLKSIPHRRTIHNAVIHQQSLIRSNHSSTFIAALISLW